MSLLQDVIQPGVLVFAACQRPYMVGGGGFVTSRKKINMLETVAEIASCALRGYYLNELLGCTLSQYKYGLMIKNTVLAVNIVLAGRVVWGVWNPLGCPSKRADRYKLNLVAAGTLQCVAVGCQIFRLLDPSTRVSAMAASTAMAGSMLLSLGDRCPVVRVNFDSKKIGVSHLWIRWSWVALGILASCEGVLAGYNRFKG